MDEKKDHAEPSPQPGIHRRKFIAGEMGNEYTSNPAVSAYKTAYHNKVPTELYTIPSAINATYQSALLSYLQAQVNTSCQTSQNSPSSDI